VPNFKRLALSLLVILACGGAGHLVHELQHGRNLAILKRRVEQERAADNPVRLVGALRRYLSANPRDIDARIELLDLLSEYARNESEMLDVYFGYRELLKNRPNDVAQREKLISYAMKLGEFNTALVNIEELEKQAEQNDASKNPRWMVWKGEVQQKLGNLEAAKKCYRDAAALDPALIEAYVEHARLLWRAEAKDEANGLMQRLVESNPELPEAFLEHARFYFEHEQFPPALKSVEAAMDLSEIPTAAVLLWSDIEFAVNAQEPVRGEHTWQERDERMRQRLDAAWKKDPSEGRFASKLCALALRRQDPDEAERLLRQGLDQSPHNPILLWDLTDLMIARGRVEAAQQLMTEMLAVNVRPGLIDYLRGRILIREQQWHQAAASFLRAKNNLAESARLSAQADIFLADCYAELGDTDERLNASRRAVKLQPFLVAARQSLAQALLAVGRIDEALAEFRTMIDLPDAPAFGWTPDVGWAAVAKVLIIRNLTAPLAARNWDEIDPVLDELVASAPDSIEATLLRAEVHAAQFELDEARSVLLKVEEDQRDDARWWIALINLAVRQNQLDEAERLVREAEVKIGPSVELKLVEARLAVYRGTGWESKLAALADDRSAFSGADRARLLYELASFYVSLGRTDRARELWKEISILKPNDLRVWLFRFDAAIDARDFAECEEIVQAMQSIEGRQGSYSQLAEAFLVLRTAMQNDDRTRLPAARTTLQKLQTQRPRWARVPWALALLDDYEGQSRDAAKNYLRAFDLGDRNPELVRRTLNLLHEQHRYDEAEDLIKRWEQIPNAPILPEINRMAAEISLERQDPQQALMRAERAVSKNSVDYRDHLWLAHIHRAGGDRDAAEAEFRAAIRLAPEAGESWVALIRHLQRENRPDEAEAVVERIDADAPPERQPEIRAICLQALGRFGEAETDYQRALELSPDDQRLWSEAAEFFRGIGKLTDSERLWRKLLAAKAEGSGLERCAARRGLAETLMRRNDYPSFREALSLVEANLQELPNSTLDLRGKATLLAMRGDPRQRREAVQLFAKLSHEETLTEQDQALVAAMHELNGDLAKAHDAWQTLAAAHPDNPTYLARYVRIQMRRQAIADAQVWLARLRKIAPDWQPALELQAELWLRDGRTQDVLELFDDYLQQEQDPERGRRKIEVGVAEERLANTVRGQEKDCARLLDAAENLFREYVRLNPDKPQVLAGFLVRTGRVAEAFELFDRAWEVAPPEVVSSVMVASLSKTEQSPEILTRARDALQRHLATPPSPGMLNDLGMIAELERRPDQAAAHYREALRIDPENVLALNNLAFLLALEGRQVNEASLLIDKALGLAGPSAPLLDTRAQVALAAGDLDGARIDREAVVHEAPSPAAWFRLAIVYHALKDERKLKDAAAKARSGGLTPLDLHFLERTHWDPIFKALDDARVTANDKT
jgi:tetratricopeptide (TPR) repeat protein